VQPTLAGTEEEDDDDQPKKKPAKAKKEKWPTTIPEQVKRLRAMLAEIARPTDTSEVAKRFLKPDKKQVLNLDDKLEELLETLVAVGQARLTDEGRFVAV